MSDTTEETPVRELDLTGLKCPLPSLMTAKALRAMAPGEALIVVASDPLAPLDIRFLCTKDGHEVLALTQEENGTCRIEIRRGPVI